MQEKEFLLEKTNDSVNSKVELLNNHYPQLNKLKKLFKLVFNLNGSIFKKLNDLFYFKGGYPKEESKPKIQTMLDDIGNVFCLLEMLDKSNMMNSYLKDHYGLNIIRETNVLNLNDQEIYDKNRKKVDKLWKETFLEEFPNGTNKEILHDLISYGQKIQKVICDVSDKINIKDVEEVIEKCDVDKKNYLSVVDLKTKYILKGDDSSLNKVQQINEDNEKFNEVVNIVFEIGE